VPIPCKGISTPGAIVTVGIPPSGFPGTGDDETNAVEMRRREDLIIVSNMFALPQFSSMADGLLQVAFMAGSGPIMNEWSNNNS
jgi:hypothetical protein